MNESKKELKWFAVFWLFLFSINSLGTCVLASLTGAKWTVLTKQEQFLIIVAIAVNWTGTMGAFMSKAMARIKDGKDPIDTNGNTETITKPK